MYSNENRLQPYPKVIRQIINGSMLSDSIYIKVKNKQVIYEVISQASDYSRGDGVTKKEHDGTPGVL